MDRPDRGQIKDARVQAFFDAIAEGNLMRVKAILAEDPDLLFADLDGGWSPASKALDSGHQDLTDYLAREELRRLNEGTVPAEHVYGAIHDLGEVAHVATGYSLADELRRLAEPVVVQFLRHEDESFRSIALNVLGLHWFLQTHRVTFTSMMFDDHDDEVRGMATACLGSVCEGSRDWEATKPLIRKLRDQTEDDSVRETSYGSLLAIWHGANGQYRQFVKVIEARRPLERESEQAGARGDWPLASQLWKQAGRVWETLVDWDFIRALEMGHEP